MTIILIMSNDDCDYNSNDCDYDDNSKSEVHIQPPGPADSVLLRMHWREGDDFI